MDMSTIVLYTELALYAIFDLKRAGPLRRDDGSNRLWIFADTADEGVFAEGRLRG